MNKMDITQVLGRTRAVLKDYPVRTELAAAAVKPTRDPVGGIANAPTKCYLCDGPYHVDRDCLD